jgi:preprotein translocase subunit SecD
MLPEPPPQPQALPQRRNLLWLWLALGLVAVVLLACGTAGVLFVVNRAQGGAKAGDVAMTVQVRGLDGAPVSAGTLDHTRQVLQSRLTAAALVRPTVAVVGADTLRVTVGPKDGQRAKSLLVPGSLTFRKVLQTDHSPSSATTPCQADTGHPTRPEALVSAKTKLGAQYDLALQIQDPSQADPARFPAFTTLTCAELAAIPAQLQYFIPTVSCAMLNGRAPDALHDDTDATVACDQEGATKYALDVPKVTGADVADAKAALDQGMWNVTLHFTTKGQSKWTALTREATQNLSGQNASDQNGAQVAITLDQVVLSAPQIQMVITGDAVVNGGGIDEPAAKGLAAVIRYGALPVTFTVLSIEAVR